MECRKQLVSRLHELGRLRDRSQALIDFEILPGLPARANASSGNDLFVLPSLRSRALLI
jgi:hypothetical protein